MIINFDVRMNANNSLLQKKYCSLSLLYWEQCYLSDHLPVSSYTSSRRILTSAEIYLKSIISKAFQKHYQLNRSSIIVNLKVFNIWRTRALRVISRVYELRLKIGIILAIDLAKESSADCWIIIDSRQLRMFSWRLKTASERALFNLTTTNISYILYSHSLFPEYWKPVRQTINLTYYLNCVILRRDLEYSSWWICGLRRSESWPRFYSR